MVNNEDMVVTMRTELVLRLHHSDQEDMVD